MAFEKLPLLEICQRKTFSISGNRVSFDLKGTHTARNSILRWKYPRKAFVVS